MVNNEMVGVCCSGNEVWKKYYGVFEGRGNVEIRVLFFCGK